MADVPGLQLASRRAPTDEHADGEPVWRAANETRPDRDRPLRVMLRARPELVRMGCREQAAVTPDRGPFGPGRLGSGSRPSIEHPSIRRDCDCADSALRGTLVKPRGQMSEHLRRI